MLPDLESLRCFVACAHHKNFRRAAAEVGLSPAAFSDRIRKLEDDVGERLFVRTTRSSRLSLAGERVLPHAKETLAAALRCKGAYTTSPQPFDLVLGTRYELGLSWLVPQLGALEKARPDRRLHLYFGDTEALLAALDRGEIDALISSARFSRQGVEFAVLHEEKYALVAAPALLAKQSLRSASEAGGFRLLDLHPDRPLFRYFLDGRAPGEQWTFAEVVRLGTIAAVAREVVRGRGVAVLPRYFIARDLKRGALVEPLPKARLSSDFFRLVYRSDHVRGSELSALAEVLREAPLR